MMSTRVGLTSHTDMCFHTLHLDHIDEDTRLSQIHAAMRRLGVPTSHLASGKTTATLTPATGDTCTSCAVLTRFGPPLTCVLLVVAVGLGLAGSPHVLVGDFNSLFRQDYTAERWERIANKRAATGWEPPRTDVMGWLCNTRHSGYEDARSASLVGADAKLAPPSRGWADGAASGEFKACEESKSVARHSPPEASVLPGDAQGTCRFDTRIDFVLVQRAKALASAVVPAPNPRDPVDVQVVPGSYRVHPSEYSDHSLVTVDVVVTPNPRHAGASAPAEVHVPKACVPPHHAREDV